MYFLTNANLRPVVRLMRSKRFISIVAICGLLSIVLLWPSMRLKAIELRTSYALVRKSEPTGPLTWHYVSGQQMSRLFSLTWSRTTSYSLHHWTPSMNISIFAFSSSGRLVGIVEMSRTPSLGPSSHAFDEMCHLLHDAEGGDGYDFSSSEWQSRLALKFTD